MPFRVHVLAICGGCLAVQYLYIILSRTIPMSWRSDKWACGAQSHMMMWSRPTSWRGNQWLVATQPHRGCTFDSPGLPTIGATLGSEVCGMLPPWGVYFSLNPHTNECFFLFHANIGGNGMFDVMVGLLKQYISLSRIDKWPFMPQMLKNRGGEIPFICYFYYICNILTR